MSRARTLPACSRASRKARGLPETATAVRQYCPRARGTLCLPDLQTPRFHGANAAAEECLVGCPLRHGGLAGVFDRAAVQGKEPG
jgi:hypothetical protein